MTRSLPKTRKNPTSRLSVKLASLMWFPVVGFHQGQRRHKLRANRPDIRSSRPSRSKCQKVLAIRCRPHMTTGVSNLSMPPHDTICWKFSKNAMDDDPRSSPASSRSTNGTMSSAIRLTPTLSSTASSTTPTASISLETACAEPANGPPKKIDHPQQAMAQLQQPARHAPWATSCRNPWAASFRNARATSSESARQSIGAPRQPMLRRTVPPQRDQPSPVPTSRKAATNDPTKATHKRTQRKQK